MSRAPVDPARARPWARGAVTGVGSLPGTDPAEALRTVLGEFPEFPFLPELPARGPGADLIGRAASLLVDMPVEIVPSGWRITGRPGRDLRRARDLLTRDLDTAVDLAGDLAGPVKFQVAGPWTLAAGVELPNGNRVLTDPGAARDLAASLAEGVRVLAADLARRLPHATIVGQLDEPGLPAVLAGTVPTASGYGTVRHVDPALARAALAEVVAALPDAAPAVVHCCAPAAPVALLVEAGAGALALDLALVTASTALTDAVGTAVDAGVGLLLGILPGAAAAGAPPPTFTATRDRLTGWWSRLGFPAAVLADSVVPTTTCGLAGATPRWVRDAARVLRDVGRAVAELS